MLAWLAAACRGAEPDQRAHVITIDAKTRFQTIEAWGAVLSNHGIPLVEWSQNPTGEEYDRLGVQDPVPDGLASRIMDAAVFDLGLNRFRLEVGPQVELTNDNDDPRVINFDAFRFDWQDAIIEKWLLPLKKRVESRGEKMILFVNYDLGRSGRMAKSLTPQWLLDPDEYAEFALATLSHVKTVHGLEADYWSVLNEPGHDRRPGDPHRVALLIRATGRRFIEAGIRTRISGPEVNKPRQVTGFLEAMRRTPGSLAHLRQITYHLYGDPFTVRHRRAALAWARVLNATTAQTEWYASKGLEVAEILHLDLTEANVSSWTQYGLSWTANEINVQGGGDYFVIEGAYESFSMNVNTWYLRQFMKYVRPGSVRVGAACAEPTIKPTAFVRPNGSSVVVAINLNDQPQQVAIDGLPPGQYAMSFTRAGDHGRAMPTIECRTDAPLACYLPAKAVVTLSQVDN